MPKNEVELFNAKYMVFCDFGPDPAIMGFATFEDAKQHIKELYTSDWYSGTFDHYIVKAVERITINHEEK